MPWWTLFALWVACPGAIAGAWQTTLAGGFGEDAAHDVAIDPGGGVVVAGRTELSGDCGRFGVARLTRHGALKWRTTVDPACSLATQVVVDPQGHVVAAGLAGGADESFLGYFTVVQLDGQNGVERWRYAPAGAVAGRLQLNAPEGPVLTFVTVTTDAYGEPAQRAACVQLDPANGTPRWSLDDCTGVLGAGTDGSWTIARPDAVVRLESLAGPERWRVSREPGSVAALDPADDLLVLSPAAITKYSGADAAPRWSVPTAGVPSVGRIGDQGDLWVATSAFRAEGAELRVRRFDGATGGERWVMHETLPPPTVATVRDLAVDADGTAYIGGRFGEDVLWRLGPTDGRVQWRRGFATPGGLVHALAAGDRHEIFAVGAVRAADDGQVGTFAAMRLRSRSGRSARPLRNP
jgi:outer membrane protein assembly factor BamB